MANIELAVELGTTNTAIYKRGSGLLLLEPSLIAKSVEGRKTSIKAVGFLAKKMQGKTADNTQIISPIKDGIINSFEDAIVLLRDLLKKILPKGLLKSKVKILFVIPCGQTVKEKTL